MERHKVALWQIDCGPSSDPQRNLEKILSCLREAAGAGARLVLFSELSLSGYTVDEKDVLARLRATTPAMIEQITRLVKDLQVATVIGLYEEAAVSGKAHNATLAIGPDGAQTLYRKTHVSPNEGPFVGYDAGPAVADLGFVRLGLSICFDNWFPETARMAYLRGAEMLHMPFFWPAEWETKDDIPRKRVPFDEACVLQARRARMLKVFPARALDNGLYLVMVDQAARSTNPEQAVPGKSMAFDPYGELIAETKGWEEEVLYFEFDPARVLEWRDSPFFPPRHLRPDIYMRAYAEYSNQDLNGR